MIEWRRICLEVGGLPGLSLDQLVISHAPYLPCLDAKVLRSNVPQQSLLRSDKLVLLQFIRSTRTLQYLLILLGANNEDGNIFDRSIDDFAVSYNLGSRGCGVMPEGQSTKLTTAMKKTSNLK
ncbi:hypothetical protein KIN20_028465 [Parelaphostrongylus tenuis]|uniref:Uncharacterized protein n=1 Tax=Parelaphostrongylus tenuis TaxID=148309 RepID=A0AAD5R0V5_PARTN|nr:hypothetical protein KIN20_028465 [Parelaphostrongylus tenuis]